MRTWLSWALGVICLGVLVVGGVYFIESYEEQVWIGASEEARRNPYLAAQRFLESRGTAVQECFSPR